jgi:signal transduction histidine kinase
VGIRPVACHDSVVAARRRTAAVRGVALALGAFGAAFGLLTLAQARSAPGGSFAGTSLPGAVAELAAGWALIAAGVAETWRRPASPAGLLLAGAGIGWFFAVWNNPGLGSPAAFTFGLIVSALAAPLVAHAALAYPTGRLASRLDLCVLVVAYAGAGLVLGLLPALFFDPGRQGCALCAANLVLIRSEPGLVNGFLWAGLLLGLGWVLALVAVGVRRLGNASPPRRRLLFPVLVPAAGFILLVGADFAHSLPRGTVSNDPFEYRLWLGEAAFLVLMALGVSWAWIRDRRTRSAVVRLVIDAAQSPPRGGLRDVLAGMLGDTGLELAYRVGEPPRHVRADGQPANARPGGDEAATPLVREGRTVAILRHRAGLLDDPRLVQEVVAATRLGMENERLHAEVLAQFEDLRAAQARIVATGDVERQRLERDLHDGAQQRLVGLSLALRLIRPGPDLAPATRLSGLIDQADRELRRAIGELRDLAHGIYPAVLADEGLAAAVEALADTRPTPVVIAGLPQERLPAAVEAAGYFLIAEASELIGTPTGTEGVTVAAEHDADRLVVHITADPVAGSGLPSPGTLTDVADRIGALGGWLHAEHAPGGALTIEAEIPCGS